MFLRVVTAEDRHQDPCLLGPHLLRAPPARLDHDALCRGYGQRPVRSDLLGQRDRRIEYLARFGEDVDQTEFVCPHRGQEVAGQRKLHRHGGRDALREPQQSATARDETALDLRDNVPRAIR
jgi:hypothetical protein